jgi:hypothetical protein
MTPLVHDAYPPHLLAQKLNNRGVIFMESGRYELAISTLFKALKVSEQVSNEDSCCCWHCSLESCMSTNENVPRLMIRDDCLTSKRRAFTTKCDDPETPHGGYIYRKPIRVSQQSMQEGGHSMGVTLSLIIILNLALVHHQSSIQQHMCRLRLQKATQLYEVAYQLQLVEDHHDGSSSLRFTMIIANNLSEIHRAFNNHTKYAMCLQHLLSTMMYLVVCLIPADAIELDGFFRNTSQMILLNKFASAA